MEPNLKQEISAAAVELFREQGLKFTMQDVANAMHISKKTIYTIYQSKEELLLDMVDDAFEKIHRKKSEVMARHTDLAEKIAAVLYTLPDEYTAMDLRQLALLDEKYPIVGARVRYQLETGWEPTLALMQQAIDEGVLRPVKLPLVQQLVAAAIEGLLVDRTLEAQGMSYPEALKEVVAILMEGLKAR